jgi:hypothetical protein
MYGLTPAQPSSSPGDEEVGPPASNFLIKWYEMHYFLCMRCIHGFLKGLLGENANFPTFHQKFFVDRTWAKVWKSWTARGVLEVVCFGFDNRTECLSAGVALPRDERRIALD